MRTPSPLTTDHKRVLSTASENSSLLGFAFIGKGGGSSQHRRTTSQATENSYYGKGHRRKLSTATTVVTVPPEPIPEAGDQRLLGIVFAVFLFGAAFVACFLAQRENAADAAVDKLEASQQLLSHKSVRSCTKLFGRPFNEIAMVDSGGSSSNVETTDIMVDQGTTFVTLPIDGDTNAAEYFIYKQPDPSFGSMPYLQYGTLRLLDDKDEFSHTSNCRCRLESVLDDNNEEWNSSAVEQEESFSFNTWDGGNSWIMSGSTHQDNSAGSSTTQQTTTTTTQTIVLLSISKKRDCIKRVDEMFLAFADQGVTLPKGTAAKVCLS